MKSIQTRLTITILAIFLVALIAMGGLNYWRARSILTEEISQNMVTTTETAAKDVGSWLEARKKEMNMLAVSPVLRGNDMNAITAFLAQAVKENPVYTEMSYIDTAGTYTNIFGAKGDVTAREWFKKAIKGEANISEPLVSKTTGKQVVVVAVPIKVNGAVTGIINATVPLDELNQKVQEIKVGQTGYALVKQGDGLLIMHPDKELVMKDNALTDAKADPQNKAITQSMVNGEKKLIVMNSLGVEKYYSYAPVPGTKWSLAILVPTAEVTGAVSSLTLLSFITIVVVLIIAGFFIAWMSKRIARPIQQLEASASRIAAGDISINKLNINRNDEIGRLAQAFEIMAGNLRDIIQKIGQSADQMAASSEELTASAEQSALAATQVAEVITGVAQGAEQQLQAVGDASAVVAQMSIDIQQAADSSNQAAESSVQAAGKAEEGDRSVTKAIAQMEHIEKTVNNSAQVVDRLGERSKEIGTIVDTISGIAGQTNLLALNAAIEAARAGEQGRGFAVVAEEVRKLAEQSQEAAKHIADLIGEIQADTEKAVIAMDEGTHEVKVGTEVVTTAGKAFKEIAMLVENVSAQVKEISAAMQQLSGGSQKIVVAVQTIDDHSKTTAEQAQTVSAATQEQSASMEEIAASSQALAKMAEDLTQAISHFKI